MKAQIVSFHCVVKDRMGRVLSSTFNQDVITEVDAPNMPLRALAEGLQDLKKGDRRRILLPAEKAYGFYEPELVIHVPRRGFPQGVALQPGHQVLTQADDGEKRTFRVIHLTADSVTLDGNHPLAGQDLVFEIEATEARDATAREIAESASKDSPPGYH